MTFTQTVQFAGMTIQLVATGAVLLQVGRALVVLVRGAGIDAARGILAEGVLAALGLGLAATLLNIIALGNWTQIRTFTVVFLLRTVLKQVFLKERQPARLRRIALAPG